MAPHSLNRLLLKLKTRTSYIRMSIRRRSRRGWDAAIRPHYRAAGRRLRDVEGSSRYHARFSRGSRRTAARPASKRSAELPSRHAARSTATPPPRSSAQSESSPPAPP